MVSVNVFADAVYFSVPVVARPMLSSMWAWTVRLLDQNLHTWGSQVPLTEYNVYPESTPQLNKAITPQKHHILKSCDTEYKDMYAVPPGSSW